MTPSDLHPKHLNTPRLVADDTQKTVWKWEQQEPFGANACNPDPDGDNVQFEFNLRFPGQYFDRESNLHYNWFRDYDPTIGRYAQSDPIGIDADLDTYAYAYSDPITYSDLFALAPAGRSGGGPRGERGATGGAAGQNSKLPYKKCREFEPPDPDWVNCQHHQTGKWIKVRRPATMPYRPTKPDDCHAAFVICMGGASRAGVLAPAIVFICAKNYENCLRTCP